jgi:putative colanic acid biosynthesis acetyltransferase WcaF
VVAIGDHVEIYNPAQVSVADYAVISQGVYLCTASHDYRRWSFPLIEQPITIGAHVWVASRAIVQMGVILEEGCVVGAGSVVTRNLPAWTVCAGNPCRVIKHYDKSHD